jgi:translocating chain-associated membrane protein 1
MMIIKDIFWFSFCSLLCANTVFFVSNALYVPVRLITIVASVLTFHFGLAKEKQGLDAANGNYNVQFVRVSCLVSVCALQAWLLWTFTTFHLRKRRERAQAEQSKEKTKTRLRPKKTKQSDSDDVNELPEVDQNTSKVLRQRKVNAK